MTSIGYQDIAGGSVHIYTAHPDLPRFERIRKALEELQHVGCIRVYLYKRRKLRLLYRRGY